jgi:hypothetical protein
MPKRKPPKKAKGALVGFCCICEAFIDNYETPEYAFDLGCCEKCLRRRIKNLMAQERAIHGLTVTLTELALLGHIGKLPEKKENT